MAAEVGEHLPSLDDLVEEVVELDDEALGSRSQHGNPAIDDLCSLRDVIVVAVAAHGYGPVKVLLEAVDGGLCLAELVHHDACSGVGVAANNDGVHLLGDVLAQACHGCNVTRGTELLVGGGSGTRRAACGEVGEAGDGSGDEEDKEEGAGVAECIEDAAEAVEGVELELERGAGVEEERRRVEPGVSEGAVVLLEAGGVAPGGVDGAQDVGRSRGGVVAAVEQPVVDRRGDPGGGGAVGVECGGAGAGEVAGVPEAGGLVHVLVEPALAGRKVEALHHVEQLRVEGAQQGGRLLEEGRREARVRAALEAVQPVRHGRVEPAVRHF
ncbi:unnamed protein product [Urochloa decumbens]|uniref:Uncharacterized protein n=1 Tax=Urochloa decumbens TaxID=240449 RepID=A0ABC9BVM3_9POAL